MRDSDKFIYDVYKSIEIPNSISSFIYDIIYNSNEIDVDNIMNEGDVGDVDEYIDDEFIVKTMFRYAKEHYDEYNDFISTIKTRLRKHFDNNIDYLESDIIEGNIESGFYDEYYNNIISDMFCDERILGRWMYDRVYLILYSLCKYEYGKLR